MEQPFATIIVPIYNGAAYLEECIKSVLSLTQANWELILVNDGSTDSSGKICEQFAAQDNRIVYLEQQNAGVSVARNNGMALAKGKWITFLDADDTLADFALDIPQNAPENCEVAMAGFTEKTDGFMFSKQGILIPALKMQEAILNLAEFKKSYKDTEVLNDYNNWSSCAHFFKASYLKEQKVQFTQGVKLGEDLLFCLSVYQEASFIWLNNSNIYYYRPNETSATHQFRKDLIDNTALLVQKVHEQVKCKNQLWHPFYRFVIFQLTRCYFNYYMDPRSGLDKKEAYKLFVEFSRRELFDQAVKHCGFTHLVRGKKNYIQGFVTLLCLKCKLYKLHQVITPLIIKICA